MNSQLCSCGCGQQTPIAKRTDTAKGWVKGQPLKCLRFHNHPSVGPFLGNRGYVLVYLPDHPNATKSGHVGEHVLVVAKALGKPIPKGAEVHHVDGDRARNVGGNLVLCPDSAYHRLIEQRTRAFRACGVPSYRKCVRCKRYDDPSRLRTHGPGSMVHSRCNTEYMRGRR